MNLTDVTKAFATEDQCLDFLEKMRWPQRHSLFGMREHETFSYHAHR